MEKYCEGGGKKCFTKGGGIEALHHWQKKSRKRMRLYQCETCYMYHITTETRGRKETTKQSPYERRRQKQISRPDRYME